MLALDRDTIQFESYMESAAGSIVPEWLVESKGDFCFTYDMDVAFKPATSCTTPLFLYKYGIAYC